jgi:ribulose-phosphate 3-epimerase
VLKCSTSLWSADLANLEEDIKRVEPFSERLHLDVADGHYVPNMLFFPDLVKSIRPHTDLPFEMHLMATDPMLWVDPFLEAGVDIWIVPFDSMAEPGDFLDAVRSHGKRSGLSLMIHESLDLLDPYWERLDVVTLVATAMGVKGASMDETIPDKIRRAREIIVERGCGTEIEVDGGIRRNTVPLMYAAGADFIVPGSLMFGGDPAEMRAWLAGL